MLNAEFSKQLEGFSLEISLSTEAAQTHVLVGESGAGKTTLLNILAGLLHPDSGRIQLNGRLLFDDQQRIQVPAMERPIAYVFQDYALFPHLSVYENVAFGLRAQRVADSRVRSETQAMLEQLGIDDLASRRPSRLSGGQQQRVALARALILKPQLLLLDEPLSALDLHTRRQVRAELRSILAKLPCATLFVTHSPFEAMVFGDRMAVVEQGRIVQVGGREELLRQPRSRYVAELIGVNWFQGKIISRDSSGLAAIETRDGILHAVGEDVREESYIAVDPREITLHTSRPTGTAQNVFEGQILELLPEPPQGERVRVVLKTHPPLVAEITAHSVQSLGLREGSSVFASFKATAARTYP